MLPYNIKRVFLDDHSNASGILLASSTNIRTAISGYMYCGGGKDNALVIGSTLTQPNQNNIFDSETVPRGETYMYQDIPPYTPVYYVKGLSSSACAIQLLYTDYKYSSTTVNTETATATTTYPYTYHDWLFTNGVIIFMLSFIAISMIFSSFTIRK